MGQKYENKTTPPSPRLSDFPRKVEWVARNQKRVNRPRTDKDFGFSDAIILFKIGRIEDLDEGKREKLIKRSLHLVRLGAGL